MIAFVSRMPSDSLSRLGLCGLGFVICLISPSPIAGRVSAPQRLWHASAEGWGVPAVKDSTTFFLTRQHGVLAVDIPSGRVLWRAGTDEPGERTAGSAVLAAGPLVVVGDYNVVSFDAATGATRWRFVPAEGYGPGIYLGSVTGDLVLAGSPSGRVFAVNHKSGRLVWSAAIGPGPPTTVFAPASDVELVAAGYTRFATPQEGGIAVWDLASGRERWRATFPPGPAVMGGSRWAGGPILANNVIVASDSNGQVYGFDRANGSVLWSISSHSSQDPLFSQPRREFRALARTNHTLFVGPAVSGDKLFLAGSDGLWAFRR